MRLAYHSVPKDDAQQAKVELIKRYGEAHIEGADIVIALGGDGAMLEALHKVMGLNIPVYGMNFGSVGFLTNEPAFDGLIERLKQAECAKIHPLRAQGTCQDGQSFEALAVNEVSLLRETGQSAKLRVSIDDKIRLEELTADGVLLATPAGSTAYNLSAHGPILPLDAQVLALTPISAFRPRRWRGALLRRSSVVRVDVLKPQRRPVLVVADKQEFREAVTVTISEARDQSLTMLFDKGRPLDERILTEQFVTE